MKLISLLLRLMMLALVVWFVARYIPGAASVLDALRSDIASWLGNLIDVIKPGGEQ